MKLVSLNVWGGMQFDPLMAFVRQYAPSTDIFCFQEVFDTTTDLKSCGEKKICRANLLAELESALPAFTSYFIAQHADYVFVSPGIEVKSFAVPNVAASDHLSMFLEFTPTP